MKKKLFITAGYLAIVFITVAAILIGGRSYTVYLPNPYHSEKVTVTYSEEGIAENTDMRFEDGSVVLRFTALKPGTVDVAATVYNEANEKEFTTVYYEWTVLPTRVLYLSGYDYGGFQFTIIGMTLLTLYSFGVCLAQFIRRKRTQFFSYKTMLDLALMLFFGLQGMMYSALAFACVLFPQQADGWHIYNLAGFTMSAAFILSIPFLVLVAGFLSFSNLALIRREGFGKNNLFGIFISLVLFVWSVLCVVAVLRNPNSTGVELTKVRDAVIRAVVSSSLVYFECILVSAMACTQYAARHEPKYNQDFIVILGCKVGKDGKPLPLLRGRIDRALTFYRKQLEATGRQACFIPSGGKGPDEVISEAECMKNYLVEQGIDESLIFPETESANTLQNMRFSKKIADAHQENANILFSTTNYHVFRSGIYSAKAGLRADGVGAKTKWYFWPNAQIREFIGLLASEWKINLLFIVAIVGISTLFANISTIINWIAG